METFRIKARNKINKNRFGNIRIHRGLISQEYDFKIKYLLEKLNVVSNASTRENQRKHIIKKKLSKLG